MTPRATTIKVENKTVLLNTLKFRIYFFIGILRIQKNSNQHSIRW
jgi:hypothetical protein